MPLKPYRSLEPASHLRVSQQILLVHAHVKGHAVALQVQLVNRLPGIFVVHLCVEIDSAQDMVLVALHAVGHKAGIHNGEHILMDHHTRSRVVQVHVLQGQALDGFLISVFCRGNQSRPAAEVLLLLLPALLIHLHGEQNHAAGRKAGKGSGDPAALEVA